MRNRIHNSTNSFQGPAKRVLCVCSAGLLRSPTMANVLHREYGYNTRSCGADPRYALIPLDEVLLHWADEIVFVEPDVRWAAAQRFKLDALEDKKLITLRLPDRFAYMAPELVAEIITQYEEASDAPSSDG